MRLLENKHGDWLVLADDDTLLGYYGQRGAAEDHIRECAAAAALRDAGRRPDFTGDKQTQRMLLTGLDALPGQLDLLPDLDGAP